MKRADYSSLYLSFQQSQKSRLPLCNLRLNNLLGDATGLLLKNCLDNGGRAVVVVEEGMGGWFLEAEVEVTSKHLSWHSCTDLNLLRLLAQWPLKKASHKPVLEL